MSAVRLTPMTACASAPMLPGGEPARTPVRYPRAATTVSPTVTADETTRAAPATMSGNVKKNGLRTPPVSATRNVAAVRATEPSTTNRPGPSASDGRRSCTTMTNNPDRARSTRIAACVSGHRPVTATIVAVAIRKTQLTIRTTRS